MNWIGQKISSFKSSLGRKVGTALHTIGSKLNHPYVGHLLNNLDDMQHRYRVEGREPDNQYRGIQLFKDVLTVPASVGAFLQDWGRGIRRNFPED